MTYEDQLDIIIEEEQTQQYFTYRAVLNMNSLLSILNVESEPQVHLLT